MYRQFYVHRKFRFRFYFSFLQKRKIYMLGFDLFFFMQSKRYICEKCFEVDLFKYLTP